MISGTTAADVAIVLIKELGLTKARKLFSKLVEVKGSKSFTDSLLMVQALLLLDARQATELVGSGKVIEIGKRTKARS